MRTAGCATATCIFAIHNVRSTSTPDGYGRRVCANSGRSPTSAGPVATPVGTSATANSILKDFLSFNDDIPRPLDRNLLSFDRDITILLHGDRRRAGLQHDLIARRNRDLLAYLQ